VRHVCDEIAAHDLQATDFAQIVDHQHCTTGGERPGVHQNGTLIDVELPILHRLPLEHSVHHFASRLHPKQLRQIGQLCGLAVAEEAPRGAVRHDGSPPFVRGYHSLDHGFHQRRSLRLLVPEIVKAVTQLPVHLSKCLNQCVNVGNAGAGKPRRCACCNRPGRCADSGQGLSDGPAGRQRQQASDEQGQQCGTRYGALRSTDYLIHLIQAGGNADYSRPAGYGYVQERLAYRRTSSSRHPASCSQGSTHLRPLHVVLDCRKWADGEIAIGADSSLPIYDGNAVFNPAGELMYGPLPGGGI
jgi:hypothetical protein